MFEDLEVRSDGLLRCKT